MTTQTRVKTEDALISVRRVSGYAVLREAMRAGQDAATWPRLSPGEARNIRQALNDAEDALAQRIEARSDETPAEAVQPEGREPGPKDAPKGVQ